MNRKIAFLLNPLAGTGKKAKLKDLIINSTRQAGIPFEFMLTTTDGKYGELEEKILNKEITDVVVVGGDGSISNVAGALRHTKVKFGIIPTGSGNGLAFAAGISTHPAKALSVIFRGYAEAIDSFHINGQFSCMLSGIGFDAKVAWQFSQSGKRGLSTYLRIGISNFFSAKPYPFRIHYQNEIRETEAYFISIANSNQFGNQFTIAPKAKLNDGQIDVVVVQKMNKFQLLAAMLQQIKHGDIRENIFRKNCILYFHTDDLLIENPAMAPFHIDGDPVETAAEFKIRVVKDAFLLIQPEPVISVD